MQINTSAARTLLSQAWDNVCSDLPNDEWDSCGIISMNDEMVANWITSILERGLTLSYRYFDGIAQPVLVE